MSDTNDEIHFGKSDSEESLKDMSEVMKRKERMIKNERLQRGSEDNFARKELQITRGFKVILLPMRQRLLWVGHHFT